MRPLPALLIGLLLSAPASAQTPPSTAPAAPTTITAKPASPRTVFDPARHMRIDEVREGMKGYGLSVLSGTKITRFDVEVISVLKNAFGPKRSVVMIRCNDAFMEHVGPIAGCSGSPIYLYDESGKPRLIGAYAYGFDLARDPIIGVQPIEYMLTLDKPTTRPADRAAIDSKTTNWSLLKSDLFTSLAKPPAERDFVAFASANNGALQPRTSSGPRLRQLMTPLSVRGMNQAQIDDAAPLLRAHGFEPALAPGGADDSADVKLEPGSVMGAAMLSGDLELAAVGTCTEVIDGRAYGFGHPFNGEGATSIPMGAGAINLVMPVLTSSFKIGAIGKPSGAIDMDGVPGIAGDIGAKAKTFPITVTTNDHSIGLKQTFNYQCAVHPRLTPMLVGMAVQSALESEKSLPHDHTVRYDIELKFEGGRSLKMDGVASSANGESVPRAAVWPAMLLANNPLEQVNLEGVSANATIEDCTNAAELLSAAASGASFKPGETVAIQLRFKPFRGDAYEQSIQLALPADLPDGDYSVAIADATTNLQFEMQSNPSRFAVRDIDELFQTVTNVVEESRSDRIFLRLTGAVQNMSIGRTSLAKLPPSKRAILEAAARPDTASGVESSLKVIEMDRPVTGAANIVIHVSRKLP